MSLPVIPRQWQDVTMMQKMALWQAPLISGSYMMQRYSTIQTWTPE